MIAYTPEFANLWGSLKSFEDAVSLRCCHFFPPFPKDFVKMASFVGVKFTKLSLVVDCSTVDPPPHFCQRWIVTSYYTYPPYYSVRQVQLLQND